MLSIFIRTIIIYITLNLLLKLMGKRQISELEVNELVSTLLISEIAAIPVSDTNLPLFGALIPIAFISFLEIFISALKNKSPTLKRAVEGKSVYIIYKGRVLLNELTKNRISINEVLAEMRTQGIGSLSDVRYGILEQNGKLSLITNKDGDTLAHTLIVDGRRNPQLLSMLGYSDEWLNSELESRGLTEGEVFLFTITDGGKTDVIEYT